MTHAAPRQRGGKTWLLPTVAIATVALLVAVGVLSRSIVLDALSWWPVWLVLAAVAVWGRALTVGRLRVAGLVAVATVVAVGVFAFGHMSGWAFMPSAAGLLTGSPASGFATAALSARVPDGGLVVSATETGPLYQVSALRHGGSVPLPSAVERAQEGSVSVELSYRDDPGLLLWNGWDLRLSSQPVWTLTLEGEIDADLRGLRLENLQVSGSGKVVLGAAVVSSPTTVSGDFVIEVPADTPVRVIGPAQIPPEWERTESGAESPVEGQGWVISVPEGSVVEIRTH